MKELRDGLKEFVGRRTEQCKVLVVGDVMLDQYYYGEVTRISPEAPVPKRTKSKTFQARLTVIP